MQWLRYRQDGTIASKATVPSRRNADKDAIPNSKILTLTLTLTITLTVSLTR